MSDDYTTYEEVDVTAVMVKSAFTSTATFTFDEGEVTTLEVRAFTLDGEEHHLIWPLQAALPLLESIMHVAMKELGGPDIFGTADIPDDIEEIQNLLNGEDHD